MRLPHVRFTVRRLMVEVAMISLYLTALRLPTPLNILSIAWATPPLLWTSFYAGCRRSAGDAMSGVEWVALFILCMILAGPEIIIEEVFPVYSV